MSVIFLDESGDPGLDLSAGASQHFVLAGALFETREDYTEWSTRCHAWLGSRSEFKFATSRGGARTSFAHQAMLSKWRGFAFVLDKEKLGARHDPEGLYRRVAGYTLDMAAPHVSPGSAAIFDGRTFRGGGVEALRRAAIGPREVSRPWEPGGSQTQEGLFTRMELRKSHEEPGIQLADFLAGATSQVRRATGASRKWATIVNPRVNVRVWP